MDGKYLDKQKLMDAINEERTIYINGEKDDVKIGAYANAIADKANYTVLGAFKERVTRGDFDAVLPEKPEQAELQAGDVRISDINSAYVVTKGHGNAVYNIFRDGSCGVMIAPHLHKTDKLLYHSDNFAEAIAWMMNHKGGEE